jgi:hypothetical protein
LVEVLPGKLVFPIKSCFKTTTKPIATMTSTMMVKMPPPSHLSLGPAYSFHYGGNRKTGSRLPKTTLLHLHIPSSAPLKPELPESPITPANPRLNLGLGTDEGPEHEHDTGYDGDVEAMPPLP